MKKILCFLMAFVFALALSVPALASSETYSYNDVVLPMFPDYDAIKADFPFLVLVLAEDGYHFFAVGKDTVVISGSRGLYLRYAETVRVYALSEDESSWVYLHDRGTTSGTYIVRGSDILIWTNFDIYDIDGILNYEGDLNFPPAPLPKVVHKVAEEHLPKVGQALVGAMKVLLPCGVGCLALLMALNLFGKVFRIFHS